MSVTKEVALAVSHKTMAEDEKPTMTRRSVCSSSGMRSIAPVSSAASRKLAKRLEISDEHQVSRCGTWSGTPSSALPARAAGISRLVSTRVFRHRMARGGNVRESPCCS